MFSVSKITDFHSGVSDAPGGCLFNGARCDEVRGASPSCTLIRIIVVIEYWYRRLL